MGQRMAKNRQKSLDEIEFINHLLKITKNCEKYAKKLCQKSVDMGIFLEENMGGWAYFPFPVRTPPYCLGQVLPREPTLPAQTCLNGQSFHFVPRYQWEINYFRKLIKILGKTELPIKKIATRTLVLGILESGQNMCNRREISCRLIIEIEPLSDFQPYGCYLKIEIRFFFHDVIRVPDEKMFFKIFFKAF